MARSRVSATISLSIADSPSSGYAECAIRPDAVSSIRNVPLEATARRFSVGSPLIRNRAPMGCSLAVLAPWLSRSSPTTNKSPTRIPAARSRSAAAICTAIIPLASHDPRP